MDCHYGYHAKVSKMSSGINEDKFIVEMTLGKRSSHYEGTHEEEVEVITGPEHRDHRDGQISTDIIETVNGE